MHRVVYLKGNIFTSTSTLMKRVEDKLTELTADGWDILNVSFSQGSFGWIVYITYYSLGNEQFIDRKTYRVFKFKKSKPDSLTKLVDDELIKMSRDEWDIVSVSMAKSVGGKQTAFITISRPNHEDYV